MNDRPSNVIDFVEFRAARARARLPLFDGMAKIRTLPDVTKRPLTPASVEHRTRMLGHLGRWPDGPMTR
jgi:hypothetical protein